MRRGAALAPALALALTPGGAVAVGCPPRLSPGWRLESRCCCALAAAIEALQAKLELEELACLSATEKMQRAILARARAGL